MSLTLGKRSLGFTLIELLVVIGVVGIVAVSVLAAVNPIEQLAKSKDIVTESDARQYLSGIERFFASYSCYPWDWDTVPDPDACTGGSTTANIVATAVAVGNGPTLESYSLNLVTQGEIKQSLKTRLDAMNSAGGGATNILTIYQSIPGAQVQLCFRPSSKTFGAIAKYDSTGSTGTTHVCVPGN